MDRDEEALCGTLVVQVAEGEAEAVVTFEPGRVGGGGVRVPQAVHLHVVLSEVLAGRQLRPARVRLQSEPTVSGSQVLNKCRHHEPTLKEHYAYLTTFSVN